jgi:hypothetical protein
LENNFVGLDLRGWSEDRLEGIGVIWDFEKGNKERGRRFVGALCKVCTNEWLIFVTFCGFCSTHFVSMKPTKSYNLKIVYWDLVIA